MIVTAVYILDNAFIIEISMIAELKESKHVL